MEDAFQQKKQESEEANDDKQNPEHFILLPKKTRFVFTPDFTTICLRAKQTMLLASNALLLVILESSKGTLPYTHLLARVIEFFTFFNTEVAPEEEAWGTCNAVPSIWPEASLTFTITKFGYNE